MSVADFIQELVVYTLGIKQTNQFVQNQMLFRYIIELNLMITKADVMTSARFYFDIASDTLWEVAAVCLLINA